MPDEIPVLFTQLREACAKLDQLAQPTYPAAVSKHSCAEIYAQISRAVYNGRRVSPHWSKPELVAAYIAIKKNFYEAKREGALQQLTGYGISRKRALAALRLPSSRRRQTSHN